MKRTILAKLKNQKKSEHIFTVKDERVVLGKEVKKVRAECDLVGI